MDVNKLVKEQHQMMIEKGFYECPGCDGNGYIETIGGYGKAQECSKCNGSKINPDKNIDELLMLIVSELGEALEAHRNGNFAPKELMNPTTGEKWKTFEGPPMNIVVFEHYIKDTFEDEIADVFLRLFDLCGFIEKEILPIEYKRLNEGWSNNTGSNLLVVVKQLLNKDFSFAYSILLSFCNFHGIEIEKYVYAKMAYNKTRDYKYGKEY